MPNADARRLRGLPAAWEARVVESAALGLEKRAEALIVALARRGRRREAAELRRVLAVLERVDALHTHAADLETLAGLYRALAVFAHEPDPATEACSSFVWTQTGAVDDDALPNGHGPAFRETAALRNRAFRLLASTLAKHERQIGVLAPPR